MKGKNGYSGEEHFSGGEKRSSVLRKPAAVRPAELLRKLSRAAAALLSVMIVLFCSSPMAVFAQGADSQAVLTHVFDDAGLLAESDAERLEEICLEVETRQEIHILMVTTEDTGGKTQQDYADDFYDRVYPEESEKNGVLVLIDIGERELWISTAGIMRYYLSDREIDDLLDHMYEEASAEDYAGAFERAAEDIRLSIERGISTGDYLIDENGNVTRYRSITPVEIGLAAAAGIAVFCLVFFSVRHSYQKKVKSDVRGYGRVSDVNLNTDRSVLVSRHVTTRRIPQSPPPGSGGSGGSSVHTSSSGTSHRGGGRSF